MQTPPAPSPLERMLVLGFDAAGALIDIQDLWGRAAQRTSVQAPTPQPGDKFLAVRVRREILGEPFRPVALPTLSPARRRPRIAAPRAATQSTRRRRREGDDPMDGDWLEEGAEAEAPMPAAEAGDPMPAVAPVPEEEPRPEAERAPRIERERAPRIEGERAPRPERAREGEQQEVPAPPGEEFDFEMQEQAPHARRLLPEARRHHE